MPKNLIKRYIPTPDRIKNMKGLGFLSKPLQNPNIWHLHRHAVAKAFFIGLFWMSIPIPSQMIFAAITAIFFRANLPLSIILVWISNPLTMTPIFYFNYLIGAFILRQDTIENLNFELSWDGMFSVLANLWQPLYLGSTLVGLTLGLLFFFIVHFYWCYSVLHSWKQRCQRRSTKKPVK